MSATPGPWHAWDRGIGWEVHKGEEGSENGLLTVVNDGFRETFTEADARLIAAAPDLLAVAKRIVEWMDANGYRADDQSFGARAAIAKAEPQNPDTSTAAEPAGGINASGKPNDDL